MASTKKKITKVERAFSVVDQLEQNEKKKEEIDQARKACSGIKKSNKRSGLQFRFSMDALISDQDRQAVDADDLCTGESNLLNFKITLPYIWKIPVIGKTALKIVKRFQADEYSESIKDILSSLRKKKTF